MTAVTADTVTADRRPTLPRSTPSEQQVDAGAVLALLDALAAEPDIEPHSLMVVRHGHVVAEGWWAPYTPGGRNLVYSLSKSFTSTAVGMAVDAGLLSLDDPVLDHLGRYAQEPVDERYRRLLLRHCLAMATGHESDTIDRLGTPAFADGEGTSLRAFFALPPEREPGTVFAYNQLATYAAARCLTEVTGQGVLEWLQPRLFEPFGIGAGADGVQWMQLDGHEMAFSGIHVTTETIAALGQLMLQRGRWGEGRLVSQEWVDAASSVQQPNDAAHCGPDAVDEPDSDWQQGYGFQFWRSRVGYRGDGAYGQFCLVWPEQDVVVVTTAETERMDLLLDLLTQHLTAGIDRVGELGSEQQLRERLAGLALPLPTAGAGAGSAAAPGTADGVYGAGEHAVVTPDGEPVAVPGLSAVRVVALGGGWLVTFVREGQPDVSLPVGSGSWEAGEWPTPLPDHDPVPFVSAGAVDADGLHAELRMVQTPHTLLLDIAGERATVRWRHRPLRGDGPDGHALPRRATPVTDPS